MAMKSKFLTTRQLAEALGITRATLQTWIATGQIKAPELPIPGMGMRLWSEAAIEGVRAYKERFFRRGRGALPPGKKRVTVKCKETAWRLNVRKRELTDGSRVFSFHPVGRHLPGKRTGITPIEWRKTETDGGSIVNDPNTLRELNMIFRFIYGRAMRT